MEVFYYQASARGMSAGLVSPFAMLNKAPLVREREASRYISPARV